MIFSLIFLISCTQQAEIVPKTEGFSADADVIYGEQNFSCKIEVAGIDSFKVMVTKPEVIKGLTFKWDGADFKISYLGIESDLDDTDLPISQFARIFKNVLAEIRTIGNTAKNSNDDYVVEGKTSDYNYTLQVRGDGFPLKFKINAIELEIRFNNIEYIF